MTPRASRLTSHRSPVDLSPLEGTTVFGEPLAVLTSALLRVRLGPEHGDTRSLTATWLQHEADAFQRAMARSEPMVPGDRRTRGQRDCDRFMAVARRVGEVSQAVLDRRTHTAVQDTD